MADPACSDPACAYRVEVERRTLEAEARASELEEALAIVFRLLPISKVTAAQRILNTMHISEPAAKGKNADV